MASRMLLSPPLLCPLIPLHKSTKVPPLPRPSSVGVLLSRAAQYATSAVASPAATPPKLTPGTGPSGKITDEFTGDGEIRQVCQVIEVVVDVRFDEGGASELRIWEWRCWILDPDL